MLQNVEIPRYCEMSSDSDLHVFVDASKNAYAACIFVRTKLASENWRHVPGRMNPADVLSRGCSPRHLLESKWFEGPEWLLRDAKTWPTNELQLIGIDLALSLFLKNGEKVWIVPYTCAVHLELVTALSTKHFLLCLRRFIARRGRPSVVYTDNGTNFKDAVREFKNLDWIKIERETETQSINRKFNPSTAA
ncbi:integrase catalytic domain-containing protein [Trichonephila clavipes]|nr:integrase catalytic domain-containing protein [Trichonephila clavipes]